MSEDRINQRYRARVQIGKGASGIVYEGIDLVEGGNVAIKKVFLKGDAAAASPAVGGSAAPSAAEAEAERRKILKEATQEVAIGRLLDHPNIIRYHDDSQDQEGNFFYIVMELARKSLLQCIKDEGPKSEASTVHVVRDILQGLEYLHNNNVIHRDIKAANVLMTMEGSAKLSDFGLSCLAGTATTATAADHSEDPTSEASNPAAIGEGDIVGTPYWMAPEVVRGLTPDKSSDIWALGCTVVEILTGVPPFYDNKNPMNVIFEIGHGHENPIPVSLTGAPGSEGHIGASPQLLSFLTACLDRNAKKRPRAKDLLAHPWLNVDNQEAVGLLASADSQDSIDGELTGASLHIPPPPLNNPSGSSGGGGSRNSTDDGGSDNGLGASLESNNDSTTGSVRVRNTGGTPSANTPTQAGYSHIVPAEGAPDPLERSNNSLAGTSSVQPAQQQLPFEKILEQHLTAPAAARESWITQQNGIQRTVAFLSTADQAQATTIINLLARFSKNIVASQQALMQRRTSGPNGVTIQGAGGFESSQHSSNNTPIQGASTNNHASSVGSGNLSFTANSGGLSGGATTTTTTGVVDNGSFSRATPQHQVSVPQLGSSPSLPLGPGIPPPGILSSSGTQGSPNVGSHPQHQQQQGGRTAFFDAIGNTDLWMLELWETVNREDLSRLFIHCCHQQEEGSCVNPAAGQGRIVSQLLSVHSASKTRIGTINALHKALTKSLENQALHHLLNTTPQASSGEHLPHPEPSAHGEDASANLGGPAGGQGQQHTRKNRKTIVDAMLEGGILQAVARVAEFSDLPTSELTPANSTQLWHWVNMCLEMILHLTHGNDQLFLRTLSQELQSTTLHSISNHCSFGAAMLVRWIRVNAADAIEKIDGIAHLLGGATDQCYDYFTRVEIVKCFTVVSDLPIGLSYLVAQQTIPMLGHILGQSPPAGVPDLLVPIFLELCQVEEFATSCSQHSKFLRVLIEKLNVARTRSDSELVDVLILIKLLFMHALQPEVWFTCAELVSLIARTLQETNRSADVLQEASALMDGFSAQTKIV